VLTRGRSVFTPAFLSRLAPILSRYVDLKRALGRRFDMPARTLQSLDRFLKEHSPQYPDLDAAAFEAWCHTYEHVASGVRRVRMLEVAAFCLYRRRTEPQCFVPDPSSFPTYHQRVKPYIFSEAEVSKLLCAASGLPRCPASPLRPEVIRLAITLLFTTGIRRGELLALTLGDYSRRESTLHIRETKFYKSRLLPINDSIAGEMDQYLRARTRRKLPVSPDTALIWNAAWSGGAYSGTSLRHAIQPLFQKCGIVTAKGGLPRIHDLRHSFAVNALLRWYRDGADVDAKLPLLATYLGHGSAVSTHYYLHFIEPLRTAASERFANRYGELVYPLLNAARRRG
jgi:integrase/recombinase XerD